MPFSLKNLLFLYLILIPTLQYAHIHKIIHASTHQNIYLFGDCHEAEHETNKVNTQQRKDFLELAQQLNAVVIVEDTYIYNRSELFKNFAQYNNNNYSCLISNLLNINRDETILRGLTAYCDYAQIPVTNVEFRFCTQMQANLQQVEDLYNRIKREIELYQDRPLLMEIYKEGLSQCAASLAPALSNAQKILKQQPKSLLKKIASKIIPNYKIRNYLIEIDMALSHLLDMRILHIIENLYKDQPTIFIVTGSWHSDNLRNYLVRMGYAINNVYLGSNNPYYDDYNALSLHDVFKKWGITIESQKKSLVNRVLDIKNFVEQKKLDSILKYTTSIINPLENIVDQYVDLAAPMSNNWTKLFVGFSLIIPCVKNLNLVKSIKQTFPLIRKVDYDPFNSESINISASLTPVN